MSKSSKEVVLNLRQPSQYAEPQTEMHSAAGNIPQLASSRVEDLATDLDYQSPMPHVDALNIPPIAPTSSGDCALPELLCRTLTAYIPINKVEEGVCLEHGGEFEIRNERERQLRDSRAKVLELVENSPKCKQARFALEQISRAEDAEQKLRDAERQLQEIRDAKVVTKPRKYHTLSGLEPCAYISDDVDPVFTALTQQVAALKLEAKRSQFFPATLLVQGGRVCTMEAFDVVKSRAEIVEAENEKLREFVQKVANICNDWTFTEIGDASESACLVIADDAWTLSVEAIAILTKSKEG